MRRTTLAGVLVAALSGATAWAGADVVLRRAVVPEPSRPHGEVRLVLRGGDVVVQTLLYTRVIRRAAGAIADKEHENWPAAAPGHDDAARFVDALASVAAAVRDDDTAAAADRRRGLRVEFPAAGPVAVSAARIVDGPDGLRLLEVLEPQLGLDLSSEYVQRNRRLIVADAFGVDEGVAAGWLAEAGKRVATH